MKECPSCHTANVDDARYCKRCSFALDWTKPEEPIDVSEHDTVVMTPPVDPARLEIELEPSVVRLPHTGTAQVRVRVGNEGGEEVAVALRVLGELAGEATVDPVNLSLSRGEQALALLELGPLSSAGARVEYEVAAEPLDPHVQTVRARGMVQADRRPSSDRVRPAAVPWWVFAAALVVVAAVVVALVVVVDGGGVGGSEGGVGGTVSADNGANVRAEPSPDSDILDRLPNGTEVEVECVEEGTGAKMGWARLARPDRLESGFIARSLLGLDDEPPLC